MNNHKPKAGDGADNERRTCQPRDHTKNQTFETRYVCRDLQTKWDLEVQGAEYIHAQPRHAGRGILSTLLGGTTFHASCVTHQGLGNTSSSRCCRKFESCWTAVLGSQRVTEGCATADRLPAGCSEMTRNSYKQQRKHTETARTRRAARRNLAVIHDNNHRTALGGR